jgi:hypothetical protein
MKARQSRNRYLQQRALSAMLAAGLLFLVGLTSAADAEAARNSAFTFAAIGDMPYELPGKPEKFERLIAAINRARPAFTVHTGDIISGRTRCSDEHFAQVRKLFDRFDSALIYTPGDNEWTDCHRLMGGHYDPLERLAAIRKMFFPRPRASLGRQPIDLESQALLQPGRFSAYVENRRFMKNRVLFVTVHVVGSRNNFRPKDRPAMEEFKARNAANLAWIAEGFTEAIRQKAVGIVFVWQANVHATPICNRGAPYHPAFTGTIRAINTGSETFRRPVLVVSGDFHFYDVAPFLDVDKKPMPHVTRLQVFGTDQVHATLVKVDPHDQNIFSFVPLKSLAE